MNSASRAVLRPRQLHSFAQVFFQPSVLHRIRQQKTERDPHAANRASAVLGRLRRKKRFDLVPFNASNFKTAEYRQHVRLEGIDVV